MDTMLMWAQIMIQQQLEINGIVYPDLRMQTAKGISCNLIEFPLLHAMFNQGMVFRGEKPCLVGTEHQLALASESFRRGLYGFYEAAELEDCDLTAAEIEAAMRRSPSAARRFACSRATRFLPPANALW